MTFVNLCFLIWMVKLLWWPKHFNEFVYLENRANKVNFCQVQSKIGSHKVCTWKIWYLWDWKQERVTECVGEWERLWVKAATILWVSGLKKSDWLFLLMVLRFSIPNKTKTFWSKIFFLYWNKNLLLFSFLKTHAILFFLLCLHKNIFRNI